MDKGGRLNTKDTNNFLSSPLVGLKQWIMGRIYSNQSNY